MASSSEQITSSKCKENIVEMTFKLLETGEENIQKKDQYKEVILVLGGTGNGKTMFTEWITGHTQLISRETIENSAEYLVEDIYGNNNPTINSDTVYPTLVVDVETNVAFYDCPGFNDTSDCNDISAAYFIKNVVDFSNSVKILLVINYPSVRRGVERHNFMDLLKHATEFIKNYEKFENSIALIVTKVDTIYTNGGKFLIDDQKVVTTIADFLEEVKNELAVKVTDGNGIQNHFYEAGIKIISYLLKREGEQYAKIGIFRRPDQSGPLNEIPLLQEGKENVTRIIHKNLTFTNKVEDDFGYTISLKSKNIIGGLVEEINKKVWQSVGHIAEGIEEHYSCLLNEVRKKIKSLHNADSLPDADKLNAQNLSCYLRKGYEEFSNLIKDIESVTTPYILVQNLKRFMINLESSNLENYILTIETQGKYFDFLQITSRELLNTRPWNELFKRTQTSMSYFWDSLQEDIDEVAPKITKDILSSFDWVSKDLQNQLDEKVKELGIQEIPLKLNIYSESFTCMVEKCKNANSINEYLKIIDELSRCLSLNMPNETALKIEKLENNFKFLGNFCEKNDLTLSSEWFHPFENLIDYLNSSRIWYSFLDSVYCMLSKYEIQKVKERYNVADLKNWGKSKTRQGIFITETNFQQFIQNISSFNAVDFADIKNVKLTKTRQKELNELLDLTLKKQIEIDIQPPSAFVTGDYIKMSDVINDTKINLFLEPKTLKFICIFASHTIFIDEDCVLPSLSLGIIAPNWEIIGERKINLNGADGSIHSSDKASDGDELGKDGEDGKPGLPGKPGGTFFGLGESFVNGIHLTITANGGAGSPGQHGGNGREGKPGADAQVPTCTGRHEIESGMVSVGGFKCVKIGGTVTSLEDIMKIIARGVVSILVHISNTKYKIYGLPGGKGGNGGNGGKGAKGGNPGQINIYDLDANSRILHCCSRGTCGTDGKGGIGAQGGYGGKDITVECDIFRPILLSVFGAEDITTWNLLTERDGDERGEAGSPGVEGGNSRESLSPEPVNIMHTFKIVKKYKRYLLKNLTCPFKRLSLRSFLNKIDEENDIKNTNNTSGIIEEFQGVDGPAHS